MIHTNYFQTFERIDHKIYQSLLQSVADTAHSNKSFLKIKNLFFFICKSTILVEICLSREQKIIQLCIFISAFNTSTQLKYTVIPLHVHRQEMLLHELSYYLKNNYRGNTKFGINITYNIRARRTNFQKFILKTVGVAVSFSGCLSGFSSFSTLDKPNLQYILNKRLRFRPENFNLKIPRATCNFFSKFFKLHDGLHKSYIIRNLLIFFSIPK